LGEHFLLKASLRRRQSSPGSAPNYENAYGDYPVPTHPIGHVIGDMDRL
jgi:hypothetical protein